MDILDKIDKLSHRIERRRIKEKLNLLSQMYMEKSAEADIEVAKTVNLVKVAENLVANGGIEKQAIYRMARNFINNRRIAAIERMIGTLPVNRGVADMRFLKPGYGARMEKMLSKVERDGTFLTYGNNRTNIGNMRINLNNAKNMHPTAFGLENINPPPVPGMSILDTPLTPGKAAMLGGGGLLAMNMVPNGVWGGRRQQGYMMTPNGAMMPIGR